jgi:serine protease Do
MIDHRNSSIGFWIAMWAILLVAFIQSGLLQTELPAQVPAPAPPLQPAVQPVPAHPGLALRPNPPQPGPSAVPVPQPDLPASGPAAAQERTAREHAANLSEIFRAAAERIVPTVVSIETHSRAATRERSERSAEENPFRGSPFEEFFKNYPFHRQPRSEGRHSTEGLGSGVIIDKSGIILTNNHVVDGADDVTVRLSDGREFKADGIKCDALSDLCVLRIHADKPLPFAKLGDSNALEIGDWVLAIGTPYGLESTVSAGIISGKDRDLGSSRKTRYLQTDAAINPGNSGGPLVDLDGEVVGINTAIATSSGGYQGIGFAIPINLARWVTDQLIGTGHVDRGYLGVGIESLSGPLADKFGIPRGQGVLVAEVYPQSPAAIAGIKEGDVIMQFGGTTLRSSRDLAGLVEQSKIGAQQSLQIIRDGKPLTLQVTIRALPKEQGKHEAHTAPKEARQPERAIYANPELGLEVAEITPEEAEVLGFKGFQGVLISDVTEGSIAADAGLTEGSLVLKVGKTPVATVAQFKAALASQSLADGILLLVRTDSGNEFVVLRKAAK